MSYSIAFIAPYKKMGELFSEICQEFNKKIIIILENIMNIDIEILNLKENWYEHTLYVEKKLKEIKKQGYNWIVGDNISVEIAERLGMNTVLVESGKEALMQSILEAEIVAEVRKRELEKNKRIKSIIDFAYEGIITVDQNGVIDTFNPQAVKIFEKEAYKIIGKNVNKMFPEFDFSKITKIGLKIDGKIWTVGDIKISLIHISEPTRLG